MHTTVKKIFLYSTILFTFPFTINAQKNVVDKVVWVVGDEPILLSDVEEARISSEMQGTPVENPYCVIPEQLAIQKLFLHQSPPFLSGLQALFRSMSIPNENQYLS